MKKITIKIKPSDLHLRNEMHFEVQRDTRMHIFNSKKAFNREAFKRETRRIINENWKVIDMSVSILLNWKSFLAIGMGASFIIVAAKVVKDKAADAIVGMMHNRPSLTRRGK